MKKIIFITLGLVVIIGVSYYFYHKNSAATLLASKKVSIDDLARGKI